jgi:hypothetical protein
MDSSFLSSLLCIEIGSIAYGYQVLNVATSNSKARVLEASPVGTKFLILMQGNETVLHDVYQRVHEMFDGIEPDQRVDAELVRAIDPRVKEALFALAQTPIHEALVIVETSTVSACLSAAQALVAGHGLVPIEIRIQRSSSGGAYGFFTGSRSLCAPAVVDVRTRLATGLRQGRVESVENPTGEFRAFFQISGEV